MGMIAVEFYCGYDLPVFPNTDGNVPECDGGGVVEVDEDDWKAGIVTVKCPKCGANLEQAMEHFMVTKHPPRTLHRVKVTLNRIERKPPNIEEP